MDKTHLKKEFEERFIALRNILNAGDLIPGAAVDEFDDLNHQILSHLYKGANLEKLTSVLSDELKAKYGLTVSAADIERLSKEIFDGWVSNKKTG